MLYFSNKSKFPSRCRDFILPRQYSNSRLSPTKKNSPLNKKTQFLVLRAQMKRNPSPSESIPMCSGIKYSYQFFA